MTKETKRWLDPDGNEIPAKYISKYKKAAERLTLRHIKKAKSLQEKLTEFKKQILADADQWYIDMLKEHNMEDKKSKGNFTIFSFDKSQKVEISVQDRIEFSDLIQVAQEKIKEFIAEKSKGIDNELQQIVDQAFTTTKGKLDVKRVLGLFGLKITHKKWLEAMELIRESMSRNHSKRYVRIFERDAEGKYVNVELNFSAL